MLQLVSSRPAAPVIDLRTGREIDVAPSAAFASFQAQQRAAAPAGQLEVMAQACFEMHVAIRHLNAAAMHLARLVDPADADAVAKRDALLAQVVEINRAQPGAAAMPRVVAFENGKGA
ncbi:hypothetical protein VQ02_33515 [Methylobacterium variabile]|uniref:Uncharacterized protein n=1 Tax=Methylobacterium variabile TaxID=298794 RepID=A0A0J6S0W8_9HYPH|nr:hypothetical protein [Methylobacterium variabile]KMO27269.1 hypothetical protein VQ02_33515 [Methylobacterium variabile]